MNNSKKLAFDLLEENSQKAYFNAIELFDICLKQSPDDAEAYLGKAVAMYNLLNTYGWTNKFTDEEITKNFDKSLELNPKNALTWFQKAEFLRDSNINFDQAIACYKKCLDLDSTFEAAKSVLEELSSKH